jgi:ABC-2 type transport system permease protein
VRRILRAYPTLLRIGLAEAVAYRAEFIVWMLTTTMPLVMLALWTAVAREQPFAQWDQSDFVSYYLGALIIRTLTGSWVVWEMNQEIRVGTLSMRLLRPIHPLFAYSAEHIAAIPLRAVIAVPIAIILLLATSGSHIVHDPLCAVIVVPAIAGAWLIMFMTMFMVGTLGFFLEKSIAVFEIWWGLFAVLSGYLVPLELMPAWVERIAFWLPFRYMLSYPVELLTGRISDPETAARLLAAQWAWVVLLTFAALALWRRGIRRFEAYGA